MDMVGQISYCDQNSHAAGEEDGLGEGRGQCEHPHIVGPFSVWKTEIRRCSRMKEGIHRALYGVIFGSYLLMALAAELTLHLQPQQQSAADMTGRAFLSSSKDSLDMET